MRAFLKMFSLISVLIPPIGFLSCLNNGESTASGTEVGNPEITVAAAAVLGLARDDSSWRMSRYVDQSLLDPSPAVRPRAMLAKKAAKACSVMVIDTSITVDTLYLTVPVIITDTLLQHYVRRDTVVTVEKGDTLKSITESRATDSIFIRDTINTVQYTVVTDTVYGTWKRPCRAGIAVVEKAYVVDVPVNSRTTKPGPAIKYDSTQWTASDVIPVHKFSDPQGVQRELPAQNIERRIDDAPAAYSLSKTVTLAGGASGTVTYADDDNDGLLYSTAAGSPRVSLSGQWQSVAGQVNVNAVFDGGPGNNLKNASDNRLLGFQRVVLNGADTLEAASYVNGSSQLDVAVKHGADSLVRSITRYGISATSANPAAIEQTLLFQGEKITRLQIKAPVVIPNSKSRFTFDFTVNITPAEGAEYTMTGKADADAGLTGQFEKDGKQYSVTIDESGKTTIRETR